MMVEERFPSEDGCVFCKKIEAADYWGRDSENDVIWFEPLDPVTEGHMLFVPMEHSEHGQGYGPSAAGAAVTAAERFAINQGIEHYNLITSSGRWSTMTQPHIHIHLVPRREGDGLLLPWGTVH